VHSNQVTCSFRFCHSDEVEEWSELDERHGRGSDSGDERAQSVP
jgi:hypothetical protein